MSKKSKGKFKKGNDTVQGGSDDSDDDGPAAAASQSSSHGGEGGEGGSSSGLRLKGTQGDDILIGGDGDDRIDGKGGNDVLVGGAGADRIKGGAGDDQISGGAGDDRLDGGEGADQISGGAGNDRIKGGAGDDVISGGDGNDQIDGGEGADQISGGAGDDRIKGGSGDDVIFGGDGNDQIDGGEGADQISGGAGDDRIKGGSGDDVISGGDGNDRIDGGEGNDTIDGGAGDDRIDGDSGNDLIFGGDGNDQLEGGSGDDVISGGAGNDSAEGGEGADVLSGGTGNDVIDGGEGADTGLYTMQDNLTSTDAYEGGEGVDTLQLNLTYGEALDTAIAADVAGFEQYVADNADPSAGGEGGEGGEGGGYQFSTMGLTASNWENVDINLINTGPNANADTSGTDEDNYVVIDVLANDTDIDHLDVLTVDVVSVATGGGSASIVNNQVVYDPGQDYQYLAVGETAVVALSYTISDIAGATSTSTVTITVTGTNDAPIAVADTGTTDENAAITVNVLANDTDVDLSDTHTVDAVSVAAGQGTVAIVANQVEWTPGTDFDYLAVGETATVVVDYTMSDNHGAASSSTLTLTVTGSNDGPVANFDTGTTDENAAITVNVLANDTDVDLSDTHTVDAVSVAAGQGTVAIVANQVEWTPGTDFDYLAVGETATVVVDYTMSDNHGAASSSTLTLTVTGANDAPVAEDDTIGGNAGGGGSGQINVAVVYETSGGTSAVVNQLNDSTAFNFNAQAVYYTNADSAAELAQYDAVVHAGNYHNSMSSAYWSALRGYVQSGQGGVTTTGWHQYTLSYYLNGNADADYVTPIAPSSYAYSYGTTTITQAHPVTDGIGVLPFSGSYVEGATAIDAGVDVLGTLNSYGGAPSIVAREISGEGSVLYLGALYTESTYSYNTSPLRSGAWDQLLEQGVAWTAGGGNAATDEDTSLTILAGDLLANDSDVDASDILTISAVSATSTLGAAVTLVGGNVVYDPSAAGQLQALAVGETATDTFTYTISDGHGGSDTAMVTLTVAGTNDGPVAVADSGTTDENVAITVNVLANDTDVDLSDTHTVDAVSVAVGQGTVAIVANQVEWTPGTDFDYLAVGETATVVVDYTMSDNHSAASSSTLTLTITGSNDGPVANFDTGTTDENATITVNVLVNDTDVDLSDTHTVDAVSIAAGQGTVAIVANQVEWTPGTDFDYLAVGETATVVVDYTMSDNHSAASSSTLTLTVTGSNDGPVAVADSGTTSENVAITVNVLVNDTDVDLSDTHTVDAVSVAAGQGTVAIVANQVEWTPGTDFDYLAVGETATVVVDYTMSDNHSAASSSTLTLTVTGSNDAPVATTITGTTTEDAGTNGVSSVLFVDDDRGLNGQGTWLSHLSSQGYNVDYEAISSNGNPLSNLGNYDMVIWSVGDQAYSNLTSQNVGTLSTYLNGGGNLLYAGGHNLYSEGAASSFIQSYLGLSDFNSNMPYTGSSAATGVTGATSFQNWSGGYYGGTMMSAFNASASTATSLMHLNSWYRSGDMVAINDTGNYKAGTWGFDINQLGSAYQADVLAATMEQFGVPVFEADLLSTASDVDTSDVLSVNSVTQTSGQNATFTLNGSDFSLDAGQFENLAEGETEVLVFSYNVNDGTVDVQNTLTVTVSGSNDGPAAVADSATTGENVAITIDVLANDTDVDVSDTHTVDAVSVAAGQGAVAIVANQVEWTPGTDFDYLAVGETATVVVGYTMSDNHGAASSSTLTLTVTGANDGPVAVADQVYTNISSGFGSSATVITEVEGNNSIATAQMIARSDFGVTPSVDVADATDPRVLIDGVLSATGDYDYFGFELRAGETVTLDVDRGMNVGNAVDTYMYLYNSAGGYITSNDDASTSYGGGGSVHHYDSFITYTASTTGTYYTYLRPYSSHYGGGDYELQISIDSTNAGIAAGIAETALLANDSDVDASDVLNIVSVSAANNGSATLSGDRVLWQPDPTGFGNSATVITEVEGNNSIATAQMIARSDFGVTPSVDVADATDARVMIDGVLSATSDYDYFGFELRAGETVTLDVDRGMNVGNAVDTYMYLYNSAGGYITSNDDASTSYGGGGSVHHYDSFITYTASTTGTYYTYLRPYSSHYGGGDYELQISIDSTNASSGSFTYQASDGHGGFTSASATVHNIAGTTISGSSGNDILVGGVTNDLLVGNGDDIFVFNNGGGNDQVSGFTAGANTADRLDVSDFNFANSTSVIAQAAQVGADTVINLDGNDSVTLLGVNVVDLHQDDFLL